MNWFSEDTMMIKSQADKIENKKQSIPVIDLKIIFDFLSSIMALRWLY